MCYAGISSPQGAILSVVHDVKLDASWTSIAKGMSIGATGLAGLRSLFERYNLASARLS